MLFNFKYRIASHIRLWSSIEVEKKYGKIFFRIKEEKKRRPQGPL